MTHLAAQRRPRRSRESFAAFEEAAGRWREHYPWPMLLLTGASGQIGQALLARLLAEGRQVRCLVRDPRRLGSSRVRVQIALGDLADPPSFRNAMRGVETVVHLAAAIRDQPQGSIEEINGIATWRMVQAAQQAGVRQFVFFSALGAATHHRSRFFRAKALAEQAVREAGLPRTTIFAPSIVYAPGDRWLSLLERLSLLGFTPIPGNGTSLYQPIWAEDVADCVTAALRDTRADARERPYELAGPQTLSHAEIARLLARSQGRRETIVPVPAPVVSGLLRAVERMMGQSAFATADEAELMEVSMVSERGAADAESLGVIPQRMAAVLGAAE